MANIQTYEAPNLGLQPSETGIEATARSAQRINMYGSQQAQDLQQVGDRIGRGVASVGEAVDQYVTHQQISAGGKHGTQATAGIEQQWNNLLKDPSFDPNDPSTAAKFNQEVVEPALEDFQKGFTTQRSQQWAQDFSERFRQHMQTKTAADMSTQAGIAVRTNAVETINNLSTSTFNDPSSLQFAKDTLAHTLQGKVSTSPNISAEDAAKVTQELTLKGEEALVKAAVQGAIIHGGNWQSIANDPKNANYINAAETEQFVRQEKQYQLSMGNAEKQKILLDKQIAESHATSFINKSWTDNVSVDDTGKFTVNPNYIKDLAKVPMLFPNSPQAVEQAERQQAWVMREQKPETDARLSGSTYTGLLRDMRAADPNDAAAQKNLLDKAWSARLLDPGQPGSMSEKDFTSFRNELEARKTPEGAALSSARDLFFKRFSFQFDPGMGMDEKTAGNSYLAEMAARQQEVAVKAKGGDPASVYDPNSPNFFGTAANINRFKVPLQQQLQTLPSAGRAVPAPPPAAERKPGIYQTPRGNMRWTGTGWVVP